MSEAYKAHIKGLLSAVASDEDKDLIFVTKGRLNLLEYLAESYLGLINLVISETATKKDTSLGVGSGVAGVDADPLKPGDLQE